MGNSPSLQEGVGVSGNGPQSNNQQHPPTTPELDFSSLYVDGEVWNDAQSHSNFLSKVQKSLLDPAFVSALTVDPEDEQVSATTTTTTTDEGGGKVSLVFFHGSKRRSRRRRRSCRPDNASIACGKKYRCSWARSTEAHANNLYHYYIPTTAFLILISLPLKTRNEIAYVIFSIKTPINTTTTASTEQRRMQRKVCQF